MGVMAVRKWHENEDVYVVLWNASNGYVYLHKTAICTPTTEQLLEQCPSYACHRQKRNTLRRNVLDLRAYEALQNERRTKQGILSAVM